MLKTQQRPKTKAPAMPQTLKLRDANVNVREFINTCRTSNEEYVIQDEDDQTVAALLPANQYASYQTYVRRREQNFAVIDRIREKMKGFDPDEIQARIDQAVEEVKAKSGSVSPAR